MSSTGGVTLLLALVEKQTRGASQCPAIITTLLNIHAASTHDATLSALLLQLQTVPRLSALLQPPLCTKDRNDVIKPGVCMSSKSLHLAKQYLAKRYLLMLSMMLFVLHICSSSYVWTRYIPLLHMCGFDSWHTSCSTVLHVQVLCWT